MPQMCKGVEFSKELYCMFVFFPFQVVHDSYFLYIFAPDNDCRLRWVRALKEGRGVFWIDNLFLKN